jgi:hypothetical protein
MRMFPTCRGYDDGRLHRKILRPTKSPLRLLDQGIRMRNIAQYFRHHVCPNLVPLCTSSEQFLLDPVQEDLPRTADDEELVL